jgi:hypothetical protein
MLVARVALLAIVAGACAGTSPTPTPTPTAASSGSGWASPIGSAPIVPVLASPELAKGAERFLFAIVDKQNHALADPGVAIHARFFDLAKDPNAPATEADAIFFWIIDGARGLYRVPVTFTSAGQWGVELTATRTAPPSGSAATSGTDPLAAPVSVRVTFPVAERPSVPQLGDPAPPADSLTLADAGGDPKKISTDPDPDPKLYELSIAGALATKEPFLLNFGTPAFCQTATCGPTLEVIRAVLKGFPSLTALHVEPYVLQERNGSLQPVYAQGQFQTVKAVDTWGLPTEPYTFLVGADGRVAARFAGPIDPVELREAISKLLAP